MTIAAAAFDAWLATPEMAALFDARSSVQAMLDFERALARAQAQEGLIDESAANAIAAACNAERYDAAALVGAAARAGSLAIPLVKQLTETVARSDAEAARVVHLGGTSQDVIDTALVLIVRRALALLDRDAGRLIDALLALAERHGAAPLLARTLLQPAPVIAFALKVAGWAAPLLRSRERLRAAGAAALKLQLGGAVGTRSVLGDKADAVARSMAAALQLRDAPPWHTQRDELVALGCEVAVLTGCCAKIARDWALLAQGEVGEAVEGAAGGSSAMPHKRNPVAAMAALAAAQRVPSRAAALLASMAQEHERALGPWQAELAEWPGLFCAAHGALAALAGAAPALQVDAARMRANIDAMQGLIFAEGVAAKLAEALGKSRAHALLETLSQRALGERRHLRDVLRDAAAADAALAPAADAALFDIDAAAQPALRIARPQLEQLRARNAAANASAPWASYLAE